MSETTTIVLRGPGGAWIDFDQYRHDLAPRHGFELAHNESMD